MALKGVKVLEFAGLAPAPFCGKILADFGASVTRIDKNIDNPLDVLQHGKTTLAINLKDERGQKLVRRLVTKYDVLIEPFRPGVMEKLKLGPNELCSDNGKLIYARLTGFGQEGRLAHRAGHDINYAAISGVLSMLGRKGEKPTPPINLLADFAGGGLMCAMGILLALLERHHSGRGQVVDAAMIDGAAYVASWLFMTRNLPIWGNERGANIFDGGAYYYDTYETKDGKFMSVGAFEPQFFEIFKNYIEAPELYQFAYNEEEQMAMKEIVRKAFLKKTRDEWAKKFEDVDACVYPVLDWQEVAQHDHNRDRKNFEVIDGVLAPKPAPRLSRTPGKINVDTTDEATFHIFKDLNLESEIDELVKEGVISLPKRTAKL